MNTFKIPKFKEAFCPFLLKRLHNVVNFQYNLKNDFSLFIWLHDHENLNKEEYIWASPETQFNILKRFPSWNPYLGNKLDRLSQSNYTIRRGQGVTGKIISLFNKKGLNIEIIYEKKIYFKKYLNSIRYSTTPRHKLEVEIIYNLFRNYQDGFISFPLIRFGKVDGVVHFWYKGKYMQDKLYPKSIGNLIKIFSNEYENSILNWDLVGENMNKNSLINLDELYEKIDDLDKNPLLKELNYKSYYIQQKEYLEERIKQNNEVRKQIIKQQRKNAITAILVESFAHNIGAHSLTSLGWWFQKRAELQDDLIIPPEFKQELLKKFPEPLINDPTPLAREIYPFINYMLEKGTFGMD